MKSNVPLLGIQLSPEHTGWDEILELKVGFLLKEEVDVGEITSLQMVGGKRQSA